MEHVYLIYDHSVREFKEPADQKKFKSITQGSPDEISTSLDSVGVDGLLIFNRERNEWNLIFAKSLGLVAQRTARRQADTISRSGFLLTSGERVGIRSRLQQLTEDNIGDLHKTVQQKYIVSDLVGHVGDSRSERFPAKVYATKDLEEKSTVIEKEPKQTTKENMQDE